MSEKSSDYFRKGTHEKPSQRSRSKKRKFSGNQHTFEQSTANTSTSSQKLLRSGDEEIVIDPSQGYCFIHFLAVFTTVSSKMNCKTCEKNVTFNQTNPRGLGFKIAVLCECGVSYINSGPMIGNAFEVNRRIVSVTRLLGIGINGLNLFCGLMDLLSKFNNVTYSGCFENFWKAADSVYKFSVKKAVSEEQDLTLEAEKSKTNLTVSGDGTWKKRGHTSRFGVITLVGKYSKKIVDTVVKSTFCQSCIHWQRRKETEPKEYEEWHSQHDDCDINHLGSASKMEVDSVKEMFGRSIETYGVKYTRYIGDGDSATYKGLLNLDPYDVPVQKLECYLHVKKRMGTRCRNAKNMNKGLGGKSKDTVKLTDKLINKLQKYYGLAITRHQDNVDKMEKEIWATFYHLSSTNKSPNHGNCPEGAESWCAYRVAEAQGQDMRKFKHNYLPIDPKVQEILKPIYEDLSRRELLDRCKGSNTQNNNESYNGLLWHFAPKHLHSGLQTLEIANSLATVIFNDGFASILRIFSIMGVKIGHAASSYAEQRDATRLRIAEYRHEAASREARTARRRASASQQELLQQEEGVLYGPGIAD